MTQTLKPRPVLPTSFDEAEALYNKAGKVLGNPKKRTVTKKKTTEQRSHSLETITKVQSHLPNIQLISRDALLNDVKNRVKINNYEVRAAIKEFNTVFNKVKELISK